MAGQDPGQAGAARVLTGWAELPSGREPAPPGMLGLADFAPEELSPEEVWRVRLGREGQAGARHTVVSGAGVSAAFIQASGVHGLQEEVEGHGGSRRRVRDDARHSCLQRSPPAANSKGLETVKTEGDKGSSRAQSFPVRWSQQGPLLAGAGGGGGGAWGRTGVDMGGGKAQVTVPTDGTWACPVLPPPRLNTCPGVWPSAHSCCTWSARGPAPGRVSFLGTKATSPRCVKFMVTGVEGAATGLQHGVPWPVPGQVTPGTGESFSKWPQGVWAPGRSRRCGINQVVAWNLRRAR